MNFDLAFFISVAAVLVMLYCLGRVASLKGEIPGGMIGKQWGILQFLVIIFSIVPCLIEMLHQRVRLPMFAPSG